MDGTVARLGSVAGVAWLLASGQAAPQTSDRAPHGPLAAATLRARGLELGYNLDHQEALAAFEASIAADPTHPAGHRLVAATMWINALFRQGAVTADDYLGQARSDIHRQPMAPEVASAFQTHIERALALSEARLRDHPDDPDAHFQVGAAYAFLTTYKATVEGRVLGGLRTARRAYNEHERVLELSPSRTDAGLVVGMYRYGVSTLSAPLRLLAGLAGFGGGRARGLSLIEQAAANPSDVQANALFTLIVIYNRERRYDDALRVIQRLHSQYPRNRLLSLEAATTALRARRFEQARAVLEDGLDRLSGDPRPRAFGEEARWRYCHGAALVGLHQIDLAERELGAVLALEGSAALRGRAHNELGKLADLAGDRRRAIAEYRVAIQVCTEQHDTTCANEATAALKTGYR
jgi:tetratricopeptide (TPR) repeat protein